ncbi:MAG: YhgE/Pip family protein, partial [Bacillota bacterium]|nr:YhgE/Pip family protein [Bacillota bacterium]
SSGIGSAISTSVKGSLTSSNTKDSISAKILADSDVQAMVAALITAGYSQDQEQAEAVVRSIVSTTLDGASSQITAESLSAAVSKTISDAMGTVAGESALSGAEAALTQVNTSLSASDASFRQLQTATADLNAGASSLSSGIGQLNTKTVDLKTGTGTLSAGVSALRSGTAQLSSNLRSGAETLKVNLVNTSEEMGDFVSAPIATEDEIYGQLDTYAQGFSPLFMSLGLWVGALLLFFVVPARPEERLSATAPQTVFSGLITASIFGIAEALVIVTGALIVGIDPLNSLALYLFAIFVSFAFVAIIQCFNLLFGLGGKIIGILLTIFQIPACGGTFPTQLMPSFFEKISPFLPMTYSIDGFREILSGGNLSTVWYNVGILAIFLLSFLIISLLLCNGTKRTAAYLEGEINR